MKLYCSGVCWMICGALKIHPFEFPFNEASTLSRTGNRTLFSKVHDVLCCRLLFVNDTFNPFNVFPEPVPSICVSPSPNVSVPTTFSKDGGNEGHIVTLNDGVIGIGGFWFP